MTNADILALFDHERRTLQPSRTIMECDGGVVRHLPAAGDQYCVLYSRHAENDLDAAIEREQAYLAARRPRYAALEWKSFDHDQPSHLADRLAAHGFAIGDPEALLALDLVDASTEWQAPVRLDVRRAVDAQGLHDYVAVLQSVHGEQTSAGQDELERLVADNDPSISVYVAYESGQPVSAGRISFEPDSQFAGLWGGTTRASYRGQGYYKALVAARLQEARRRGIRFLYIDASPLSRPILERRGFRFLGYSRPCVYRCGSSN